MVNTQLNTNSVRNSISTIIAKLSTVEKGILKIKLIGYSIVEVVISIFLLGMILLAVGSTMTRLFTTSIESRTKSGIRNETEVLRTIVIRYLKSAKPDSISVYDCPDISTCTFSPTDSGNIISYKLNNYDNRLYCFGFIPINGEISLISSSIDTPPLTTQNCILANTKIKINSNSSILSDGIFITTQNGVNKSIVLEYKISSKIQLRSYDNSPKLQRIVVSTQGISY